jgi:hypothetical protein
VSINTIVCVESVNPCIQLHHSHTDDILPTHSMLHLYESLGWWRSPELRKVHAAEEWNELHHLLIMESLGGNSMWSDRFLGYHAAIVYYWLLNIVFLFSPRVAYQFMEVRIRSSNRFMLQLPFPCLWKCCSHFFCLSPPQPLLRLAPRGARRRHLRGLCARER